jgi:hypothetical protein
MSAPSKTQAWLEGDADRMRARHVARLKSAYREVFAEHERLTVEMAGLTYRTAHDLVASSTQLRSAIERGERTFMAMCSASVRLGFLASVLRKHGIVIGGDADIDEATFEEVLHSIPLADSFES